MVVFIDFFSVVFGVVMISNGFGSFVDIIWFEVFVFVMFIWFIVFLNGFVIGFFIGGFIYVDLGW